MIFSLFTQSLYRAAAIIKEHWRDIPATDRELIKSLAYTLIEPPKGLSGLLLKSCAKVFLVYVQLTGQKQSLSECLQAFDCLIDNILDAVEREHPLYCQVLSEALEEICRQEELG